MSYNNTTHTSDTGTTCMIVVHDRRGSKYQKGVPGGEVARDDVSNEKQISIYKIYFWKVLGR